MINGSYWVGAAAGSAAAHRPARHVDRSPPTSAGGSRSGSAPCSGSRSCSCAATCPRARAGCSSTAARRRPSGSSRDIERDVEEETGEELAEPDELDQGAAARAHPVPRDRARPRSSSYPRRAVLGLALFVGQAFIYNGVTFNLGTLFTTFFGVVVERRAGLHHRLRGRQLPRPADCSGRLFDTVGRKPMIAGTYLGSAARRRPSLALLFAGRLAQPSGRSRRSSSRRSSSPRPARAPRT